MITGIEGQLGTYLYDMLSGKNVYGLTRSTKKHGGVKYVEGDLSDPRRIEAILNEIRPDEIYNIGAQSDAVESCSKFVQTFYENAVAVMVMCEYVKKNPHVKMFQASSSEIYKGVNIDRKLVEEDIIYHPRNPYGISKLTAHLTCKYYRETYGLFICNGIIFSSESPLRKDCFVSKKIANCFRTGEELKLGNVNASKDWVHSYDVADAIMKIMRHDVPGDYNICSSELHTVYEFVNIVYGSYHPCIKSDVTLMRSYEDGTYPLCGDNKRLLSIGWIPKYSFRDIVQNIMIPSSSSFSPLPQIIA